MVSERDCPLFFRAPGLGADKTLKGGSWGASRSQYCSGVIVAGRKGGKILLTPAQVAESILQGHDWLCHRVPLTWRRKSQKRGPAHRGLLDTQCDGRKSPATTANQLCILVMTTLLAGDP